LPNASLLVSFLIKLVGPNSCILVLLVKETGRTCFQVAAVDTMNGTYSYSSLGSLDFLPRGKANLDEMNNTMISKLKKKINSYLN
jgi:hypothetical protein